jgi:hypothetical protein
MIADTAPQIAVTTAIAITTMVSQPIMLRSTQR